MDKVWFVYLLRCGDGSLYCGITDDVSRRLEAHAAGKGAKYTKSRLPVRLVYYETFSTKKEAMQREYAIKQLTRKDKLKLVAGQPKAVRENCKRIAGLEV